MRIRNTKICFYACDYNELDDFADYLERKAQEGWELTSKTGTLLGFKRAEPRNVKICAEVVLENTGDMELSQYEELCEAAGWKRIFSDGSIQIYENEDPDAVPISTDPLTKLNAVHAKCRFQNGFLLFSVLPILYMWNSFFIRNRDYSMYLSVIRFLGTFFLPVMAIFVIASGSGYFLWYRKAKRDAEAGRSPVYRRSRINKAANAFLQAYIFFGIWGGLLLDSWYERHGSGLIVIGIVIACVILFMIGFTFIDAQRNRQRRGHLALYFALAVPFALILTSVAFLFDDHSEYVYNGKEMVQVFTDELPLTMEDMGIETTGYTDRYSGSKGSPFLQHFFGDDFSVNEKGYNLSYHLYTTENDRIYRQLIRERYRNFSGYKKVSDSGFTAERIFMNEENKNLVLLYEDAVLELDTDIPLSDERKKVIEEKLSER